MDRVHTPDMRRDSKKLRSATIGCLTAPGRQTDQSESSIAGDHWSLVVTIGQGGGQWSVGLVSALYMCTLGGVYTTYSLQTHTIALR